MADLKLGRCPRCKAYALVADASGIRYAVDVAPVDAVGLGKAVGFGVGLWWVASKPGRPSRLTGGYGGPGSPKQPSWAAGGAQAPSDSRLHAEHSCGAPARDIVIMNVTRPKGSAPVTPGAPGAGSRHHAAHGSSAPGPTPPSPAATATRPRSKALRCDNCNQLIDRTQPHYAIEYDTMRWGNHEECP
jgi:phage FluMu protein Com